MTAVDAVSLDTGDDPAGLGALPEFQTDTPLVAADSSLYDGWFPVRPDATRRPWWDAASALEIPPDQRDEMFGQRALPAWFADRELPTPPRLITQGYSRPES